MCFQFHHWDPAGDGGSIYLVAPPLSPLVRELTQLLHIMGYAL